MIVADLIRLLQDCDPDAVVLIPRDGYLDEPSEALAAIVPICASVFSSGPAAIHGAIRLAGITTTAVVVTTGPATGGVRRA